MKISSKEIIVIIFILLSFAVGGYLYPQLPERMVSHWNVRGNVDGYIAKSIGIFLMPSLLFVLGAVFFILPRSRVLKFSIRDYRSYYESFMLLFFVFMFLVYLQVMLWNVGFQISPSLLMPPGFAVLFYYAGIICNKIKRNRFIGIRTPWTMEDDLVWHKTHSIGAKLFKASGVIAFLGLIFKTYALYFVIVPVVAIAIFSLVYSFKISKSFKRGQ